MTTTEQESTMATNPRTRTSADDDGDDSTTTRPDGTQTDGMPADQSHADSAKEQAEAEEDRGAVNPSEVDDSNPNRKDGAVTPEESIDSGSVAAQREADEIDSALREIAKRVGGVNPAAASDPDRDTATALEGTLAGRLRSLAFQAKAISRRLESVGDGGQA